MTETKSIIFLFFVKSFDIQNSSISVLTASSALPGCYIIITLLAAVLASKRQTFFETQHVCL